MPFWPPFWWQRRMCDQVSRTCPQLGQRRHSLVSHGLVAVVWSNIHDLIAHPFLKHTRDLMEGPVYHFTINQIKLQEVQNIYLIKLCLSQLCLHPEMELLSLVRWQCISTKKYTQGFQVEMPSRGVGLWLVSQTAFFAW